MASQDIPKARWWLLGVHAVGVSGLTVLVLVGFLTTPPDAGANIGAGVLLLPLLALGLPWSALFVINPYRFDGLSEVAWYVVVFAPAMVNVVIHAAVLSFVGRRRRRRPVAT